MKHKILYFSDCAIYGGSDRNIINIANYMAELPDTEIYFAYRCFKAYRQGVERDLSSKVKALPLALLSSDTLFQRLNLSLSGYLLKKFIKLPFWVLQKFGFYTPYNYLVFRKLIEQIKPDLLHVNNGGYPASFTCQIAIFAARHAGINKIIYHINNPAQNQDNFLDKFIDRRINDYTTCFITASKQALESLKEKRSFNVSKLSQIFNTVENQAVVMSRQEILRCNNVSDDKFVLCEVAFLSERKGQIYILEALNKIREIHPDIFVRLVLFLVGDGEDVKKLKKYCELHELSNVVFTGYQSNYMDYIACADVFLLPSTGGEDMPLVILSAMNCGIPIIASEIAGIAEEIENLKSGILLKLEHLDDLYLEIVRLFLDSDLRHFYAENAKKRFNDNFAQNVVYEKIKTLYTNIGLAIEHN